MSKQTSGESSQMQGEGNREADRQYRQGATQHAKSGRTEQEAREAERAIDEDESGELKEAEQAGKSKAVGPASR
jgi:hypothetical protein